MLVGEDISVYLMLLSPQKLQMHLEMLNHQVDFVEKLLFKIISHSLDMDSVTLVEIKIKQEEIFSSNMNLSGWMMKMMEH